MGKLVVLTPAMMEELSETLDEIIEKNRVYGLKYVIGNPLRTELQGHRFASVGNANQQVIQLAGVIPPFARILDVFTYTSIQWTGAVSLGVKIGNATGGEQFLASTNMYTMATKACLTQALDMSVAINDVATDIFVSVTPGANWSLITDGLLTVYITYIDLFSL